MTSRADTDAPASYVRSIDRFDMGQRWACLALAYDVAARAAGPFALGRGSNRYP